MKQLSEYKYLIFDCDGIILNSNKIKSQAFIDVVSCYGEEASSALVKYHRSNGGISRYEKFGYFCDKIAKDLNLNLSNLKISDLLEKYAFEVKNKLEECEMAQDILEFRKVSNAEWYIVSGSDQKELIEVFKKRKLIKSFDGGIYGSPSPKDEIFKNMLKQKKIIPSDSLYIGDSKYDYLAAINNNIDFVFLTKWSEFHEIKSFAIDNNVEIYKEFLEII